MMDIKRLLFFQLQVTQGTADSIDRVVVLLGDGGGRGGGGGGASHEEWESREKQGGNLQGRTVGVRLGEYGRTGWPRRRRRRHCNWLGARVPSGCRRHHGGGLAAAYIGLPMVPFFMI